MPNKSKNTNDVSELDSLGTFSQDGRDKLTDGVCLSSDNRFIEAHGLREPQWTSALTRGDLDGSPIC